MEPGADGSVSLTGLASGVYLLAITAVSRCDV